MPGSVLSYQAVLTALLAVQKGTGLSLSHPLAHFRIVQQTLSMTALRGDYALLYFRYLRSEPGLHPEDIARLAGYTLRILRRRQEAGIHGLSFDLIRCEQQAGELQDG